MPMAEIAIFKRGGGKVCSFTLDDDQARWTLKQMTRKYGLKPLAAGKRWNIRYSGLPGTGNDDHILAYRAVTTSRLRHIEARADEIFRKPRTVAACG